MGIKYVGPTSDRVYGRTKRQNVTRWMYIPKQKYKPAWDEVLCATLGIIGIIISIIFFAVLLANL